MLYTDFPAKFPEVIIGIITGSCTQMKQKEEERLYQYLTPFVFVKKQFMFSHTWIPFEARDFGDALRTRCLATWADLGFCSGRQDVLCCETVFETEHVQKQTGTSMLKVLLSTLALSPSMTPNNASPLQKSSL